MGLHFITPGKVSNMQNMKYSFKIGNGIDLVINNMLCRLNDKMRNWSDQKTRILNLYREGYT